MRRCNPKAHTKTSKTVFNEAQRNEAMLDDFLDCDYVPICALNKINANCSMCVYVECKQKTNGFKLIQSQTFMWLRNNSNQISF